MRGSRGVAWLVVAASVVVGCTVTSGQPITPRRSSQITATGPFPDVSGAGWTIQTNVPVKGTSKLVLEVQPSSAESAVAALAALRAQQSITSDLPARITLSGDAVPAQGLTISRTLPAPLPAGHVAALAYFDATHNAWTAVPTTLSRDGRSVSAVVHHLSVWDTIYYDMGSLLSVRRTAPTCVSPTPSWLKSVNYLVDRNAPVLWCAGHDPNNPALLVVKVAVNRSYGVAVKPAEKPSWTWDSLFQGGPEDILTSLLADTLVRSPQLSSMFGGRLWLGGDAEADFGFSEAQTRSAGGTPLVSVDASAGYAIAGLTYRALSKVLDGNTVAAVAGTLAGIGQCGSDITSSVHDRNWFGAAGSTMRCLGEHSGDVARDLATVLTKAMPSAAPEALGELAGTVAAKLWIVWAAGEVFQIVEWVTDQTLGPGAWQLDTFLAPPQVPVLGKVWAPDQEGYGTAQPATIFNGGDPTGLVINIRWQSWGGPTAVGTGTSIDDSNSPTVADAPTRQATVVAFDLGTCNGQLMYEAVDWYFPAIGQKFDPHDSLNMCTGAVGH
jgi:hypothetical protein